MWLQHCLVSPFLKPGYLHGVAGMKLDFWKILDFWCNFGFPVDCFWISRWFFYFSNALSNHSTAVWVRRPERTKDDVKQTQSRPQGPSTRSRVLRLLVINNSSHYQRLLICFTNALWIKASDDDKLLVAAVLCLRRDEWWELRTAGGSSRGSCSLDPLNSRESGSTQFWISWIHSIWENLDPLNPRESGSTQFKRIRIHSI